MTVCLLAKPALNPRHFITYLESQDFHKWKNGFILFYKIEKYNACSRLWFLFKLSYTKHEEFDLKQSDHITYFWSLWSVYLSRHLVCSRMRLWPSSLQISTFLPRVCSSACQTHAKLNWGQMTDSSRIFHFLNSLVSCSACLGSLPQYIVLKTSVSIQCRWSNFKSNQLG